MRGVALAGCLALSGPAVLSFADAKDVPGVVDAPEMPPGDLGQHLAVVVPVYRGDLSRAVSSLERWPSTCSPLTERNADLVLYYAEGEEDAPAVSAAVDTINETAGSCFAKTRLVYAHLSEEEDVYPKGPSVMFFKMFLDEGVHADLSEYDALAIVEWDVLVASDRSFEELHHAAFRGNEDFWMKGSNLGGTNFHSTAQASEMWNVLGHINGNAIYNNNDPAFVEYVDYTRTRWEYTYPYDVALWLTISDFPYSWPLWQRYSSKFVTTNLISYVGYEHVDHTTVSDAVAGQTLFIHGSMVDEGNIASLKATRLEKNKATASGRRRLSDQSEKSQAMCSTACGSEDTAGLPVGTSTVCDDTCAGKSGRFGGFLCGAGDSERFGFMCRLCYVDEEEARKEEQSLALKRSSVEGDQEAPHVIMCDTLRPPEAADCSDKCGLKKDTVCDESCGTGRFGDYNCNWRDHGPKCRFCFDDLKSALLADNVAKRRGGRVIMCSTFEPPQAAEVVTVDSRTKALRSRKLQPWRDNAKWETLDKWRGDPDNDELPKWQRESETPKWRRQEKWRNTPDDEIPKWRRNEKWRNNLCDEDGCPHTNSDGRRGRVCDDSCADGVPYGTFGCVARDGAYGNYCRVCYFDQELALANDSADERAIMCDTVLPVEGGVYRRLAATTVSEGESAANVAENLKSWKHSHADGKNLKSWKHSHADGKNLKSWKHSHADGKKSKSKKKRRKLQPWRDNAKWETLDKWRGDPDNDELPKWQRESETPKWRRQEKWRNTPPDEIPKWQREEKWRNNFCDEDDCPHTNSDGRRGRVCDDSCADGVPYGTFGCGARDGAHGNYCRVCYFDQELALANDSADERAIMCDTVLPVQGGVYRRLAATTVSEAESAANVAENLKSWKHSNADGKNLKSLKHNHADGKNLKSWKHSHADGEKSKSKKKRRKLQPWRDNAKWETLDKWRGDPDNDELPKWQRESETPKWRRQEKWRNTPPDEIPKWQREEKWRNNFCDEDGCPHTNSDGRRGRVCDDSCADGVPYGTFGCGARDGAYGNYCRVCYFDQELALANDSADERAIMCDTVLPVQGGVYRRLAATTVSEGESAANVAENLKSWKHSHADGKKSKSKKKRRKLQPWRDNAKWETLDKWRGDPDNDELPKWQRESETPKWRRQEKWRNTPPDEIPKWQREEKWRNNFCDEDDCPHTNSDGRRGRVCDDSCADGVPYGTFGCGARDGAHGNYCRVCYFDQELALANDSADERAIMCDTVLPVQGGVYRRLAATTVSKEESAANVAENLKSWKHNHADGKKRRKLQPWRDNAKWETLDKWRGDPDNDELPKWQRESETPKWRRQEKWRNTPPDEIPKWQREEKWRNNFCDEDDCPHTNSDGRRGRVCDDSCADGVPYGTFGCGARDGAHGNYCRVCYFDQDLAIANDSADERAIMCDTVLPVQGGVYRRLSATTVSQGERASDALSMFAEAAVLPYVKDLVRGNLCAFIAGSLDEIDQVEVAVMSVLQFLPGMTVAVAAENAAFDAYDRAVGTLPGVTVHTTEDPFTASLFADDFCGVHTSLIFYMKPGSIVSRHFMSKDTHSTHGDLLVVHGDAQGSMLDRTLARQTTAVLGFESPSFTFNTDLFLPVGANAELREVLVSGEGQGDALEVMQGFIKTRDMSAVPQVMAALAYSRNTPGVWFIDPQTWVSQHLFRDASIWEIPLVKPHYTCSIDPTLMSADAANLDVAAILQSNLDFFTHGGTCDSGFIDVRHGD